MRRSKLHVASALTAAIGLAVAGGAQPQPVKDGGTFRIAFPADRVESIDPFLDNFPPMQYVFQATCASLLNLRDVALPAGNVFVPELAESLPEISNRAKTYTFTVRRGYRFSTGAPVTVRDVASTVRRALRLKGSWAAPGFMNVVGARAFMQRRASTLTGVRVVANRISFRLKKPQPDFVSYAGTLCVLPAGIPLDAEGARAPVPSAGPYTLTEYVAGRRILVERNRFYSGPRPHHVDRFEITLVDDQTSLIEDVERGTYDWMWTLGHLWSPHVPRLVARYGVNRGRFRVTPDLGMCMLTLNAARPLFRNNPKLRRAVNYAIDRRALAREWGPRRAVPNDQYLLPARDAFRGARIYPFRPDVPKARALARGNRRSAIAVFYTRDDLVGRAHGAIVRANLAEIGLTVEVRPLPSHVLFETQQRGGSFDIGWICWSNSLSVGLDLHWMFDGRTLDQRRHGNYSRFDSRRVNRRLDEVARLLGPAFDRAYGDLDVELARDYAPAVAYAHLNAMELVSARTGCVVVRPTLDLAAVCLRE